MRVTFLYRKAKKTLFSIEGIFDSLISQMSQRLNARKVNVKNAGTSPLSILKNLRFASQLEKDEIHHITGDIHYLMLMMNPEKTILTIHDCVSLNKKKSRLKHFIIKKLWYDLPIKRARYITTISQKSKDEIIEHTKCDPSKIEVINNSYNPIFKRTPYKFNKEKPIILQIGTRENKNLQNLLPALNNITCQLRIIGELSSDQVKHLEQYEITYSCASNLSDEDLYKEYQKADLVTFVSTYEGFGMPIIEAQAVGVPVITSNLEPMKSIINNNNCLVDPTSIRSITEKINEFLFHSDLRNDSIDKGLENVKKYTIEAISQKYIDLYEKISKQDL